MNQPSRRHFIASGAALAASAALPATAFAQERRFEPQPGTWRTFDLVTTVNVAEVLGTTRLWLPIPDVASDWQQPVDWVMTNPPWSRLRDFSRHAMRIAPNIVWLAPLTNLTTKARLRDLNEAGFGIAELVLIDTPKDWPQSGFQLVAALLRKGHSGGWSVTRLAG